MSYCTLIASDCYVDRNLFHYLFLSVLTDSTILFPHPFENDVRSGLVLLLDSLNGEQVAVFTLAHTLRKKPKFASPPLVPLMVKIKAA